MKSCSTGRRSCEVMRVVCVCEDYPHEVFVKLCFASFSSPSFSLFSMPPLSTFVACFSVILKCPVVLNNCFILCLLTWSVDQERTRSLSTPHWSLPQEKAFYLCCFLFPSFHFLWLLLTRVSSSETTHCGWLRSSKYWHL